MLMPTLVLLPPLIATEPAKVVTSIVRLSVACTVSTPPAEIASPFDASMLSI